jgi:4-amino-4-deoxy-L-arabinose transferase-like glycosyltransferase
MKQTTNRLWPVLLIFIGFALRIHTLGAKSFWYDELRQIEVAQHPLAEFPTELVKHSARPLDYLLTRYLLQTGQQEFWLRFPAALWGALSVALTFALAQRWFDRQTAWIAAMSMAAAPIGVQYSQELRPYALYLLFALVSFWNLDRALQSNQPRHWAGFALASIGGTLTHFFYTFLLTAQVIYVAGLFALRKLRWPQFAAFSASASTGYAALFIAASPFTLVTFAQRYLGALVTLPVNGLTTDTGVRLSNPDTLNLSFFVNGILPFYGGGPGVALLLFSGFALIGLIALMVHNRRLLMLFVLWLLLAPALILIYLQYRQQFFAIRYILFVLPAYLLLIAHGLVSSARRLSFQRPAILLGLLVLAAFDLNQVSADYRKPKDDWRRVGAFLTANVRLGDAVAAPDVQFFIRFYAPDQPGSIVDANDVGPHEEALANAERFWFVWSDYTLIPIEDTRQWAKQLPGVTFELDPRIKIIYVHPGLTQAEMQAEAQQFAIPPPSIP